MRLTHTLLNCQFYKAIIDFHRYAGNVDLDNHEYDIVVGMGGHQILSAAIFALSQDGPKTGASS